jgi:hypothetical protein
VLPVAILSGLTGQWLAGDFAFATVSAKDLTRSKASGFAKH